MEVILKFRACSWYSKGSKIYGVDQASRDKFEEL